VLEKYPRDVKLVYKSFPLPSHKFARPAAVAALAAGEQGKFWEFHDLLFENYNRLNEAKIQEIAQAVGLDMARYEKSKKDPKIMAAINRDLLEARKAGVRGTPTIFVNGRLLTNRSLAGFSNMIEREIKKAGGKM
jgi:protein-disulfide isomerase